MRLLALGVLRVTFSSITLEALGPSQRVRLFQELQLSQFFPWDVLQLWQAVE
jgi:hypothetical protein